MAHYNSNNSDISTTSSYSEDSNFSAYQLLSQPPAVGRTGLRATAIHETTALATPYTTGNYADSYGQPSYAENHWPAVDQQVECSYVDFQSWESSSVRNMTQEASAAIPGPSIPFDYWGDNRSRPSTNTFDCSNMHTSYQHNSGPTRIGPIRAGRFQPYGRPLAQANEHRSVQAGPSTSAPCVGPSTSQPFACMPGKAAAEINQTTIEEVETLEDIERLCDWVQRWKRLPRLPSGSEALAVAADIVRIIRLMPVYQQPRLFTTVKGGKGEWGKRRPEHRVFQELSRYYRLDWGHNMWRRPLLLKRVLEDLEDYYPRWLSDLGI